MAKIPETIDKYRILEKIEESNYAIIYKVYPVRESRPKDDSRSKLDTAFSNGVKDPEEKPLVLKIARDKSASLNELIAREFQILSQFQHPNIVSVYDYNVVEDGRAYFTSEYVSGKPINSIFHGLTEEFIIAKMQIINALAAFHNKGFIHSDLKPDHILYNSEEKRAVLIDFGFAGNVAEDLRSAGTIGYMAPEVIKGIGINQQSDLYSLGVIIYEILSGKKPEEVYKPIKGVSEETNTILSRMLSQEPAIRPTVLELYQTFSKYLPSVKVAMPVYEVKLPDTGFVELPEIEEWLSRAKGEAIIITGETGSGKTRLLKELKYKYLLQGNAVLMYLSGEKTKFSDAVHNFINLKQIDLVNIENKFQIFEEIMQNLLEFSKDKNVVIMIDDLDNLSDYELSLFRYLGYGIHGANILIIGGSKSNERIAKLGFETITLRSFSQAEVEKLLEKTFFALSPVKTSKGQKVDFSQWLHKESGGNPLFIVEILKHLYENKVIQYQANQWQVELDLLKKIAIPKKLDDLLESRIKNLDIEELKILKILCLANYPLEPSVISLILEKDTSLRLEHLKNLGLIREETIHNRRVVLIPNQILSQIIEKALGDKERQLFSQSLIKVIEALLPEDKDYLPVLARLSDEVGETKKAYDYFQTSAVNAEAIYDYESAISYYEKLAQYSEDLYPDKYAEYLVKLGGINQVIGNTKLSIDYYNKALKLNSKDFLPKIYSGLGRTHITMGNYSEGGEYYRRAMELMETRSSEYIEAANLLGYTLTNLLKFREAEAIFNKSVTLSKEIKDIKMKVETLYYLASLEWFRNDFQRGIARAEVLLDFCEKKELIQYYAPCANLLGSFYQQKGDIDNTRKYLDAAIEGFNRIKHFDALCRAMNNRALSNLQKGEMLTAKTIFEETLVKSYQTENRTVQYIALANLASINEDLGRFDEAINLNKEALNIETDYVWSNYNLSMLFYKKCEIDKTKSILEERLKIKEEILYYFGLALIDMALGKTHDAEELLSNGLDLINKQKPEILIKTESFLKAIQVYYEMGEFVKSLDYSMRILELTNPLSKEYNIANAFIKINNFNLKNIDKLDIIQETQRLKEIGYLYDYAYLKKLEIESLLNTDLEPDGLKQLVEDLNSIKEIFESIGANLELNRVKKLQEKLFPIMVRDYSRKVISDQYLDIFSHLAELISNNLGDENFIQQILDLVIKATNAARGALFIKSATGMEFIAGQNIDHETIKDASELSHTAIKELEKNKLVFAQDALSDPNFNIKKSVMVNQIRSLLCIPLSVSGNVIGAIYCDSRLAGSMFGPQDKDFLLTVSKILASVIEKSIAFRSMQDENILLRSNIIEEIGSSGYLMGKSQIMKRIYKLIDSVAETNSPVLILGETGTGKGMIAKLIHLKSPRQNKKFLAINCGTIPETLLESELFGHKRGAFTGAVSDKKGLLEEAEGGTIFLDEISNTSLAFQGKLLEAIEEKIIRRVGETVTRNIDVRFLFATNKDLEIEVEDSRFRRDLLYRINVFSMEVPPLRERVQDIPLLAQFFLEKYSKEIGKRLEGFASEAVQQLREYIWLGNVRELQNVIERAVVLAKGHLITLDDIGFEKTKRDEIAPLKEIRREAIIEALNSTGWNIKKTAELLGIGRRSLYRYIKEYNIPNNSTRTIKENT